MVCHTNKLVTNPFAEEIKAMQLTENQEIQIKKHFDDALLELASYNYEGYIKALTALGAILRKIPDIQTQEVAKIIRAYSGITTHHMAAFSAFNNAWKSGAATKFSSSAVPILSLEANDQEDKADKTSLLTKTASDEKKAFENFFDANEKSLRCVQNLSELNLKTLDENTVVLVGTGSKRTAYFIRKGNFISYKAESYEFNLKFPFIHRNINDLTSIATITLSQKEQNYLDQNEQDRLAQEKINNSAANQIISKATSDHRHLVAKFGLNKSTRKEISLSLKVMGDYLSKANITDSEKVEATELKKALNHIVNQSRLDKLRTNVIEKLNKKSKKLEAKEIMRNGLIPTGSDIPSLTVLDENAIQAIRSYQTPRQKVAKATGLFLAGVMAIAFGMIETGTAVFMLASNLPVAAAQLLGFVAGSVSTYITWRTFKDYAPNLLKDLGGKDKFAEGLTNHVDGKKGKQQLNFKQKTQLILFALLAALPTGAAIGALGFTSTLSVPAWLGIGAASIFPPIGMAFAGLVALKMTLCLIKTFVNFLREGGDPIEYLKKPFIQVNKTIDESEQFKSEQARTLAKAASYVLTSVLVIIGLAGLAFAAYTCSASLSKWSTDMIGAGPTVANFIGIAAGGIASILGRMLFTFKTAADSTVSLCKRLFSKDSGEVSKTDVALGITDAALVAGFFTANNISGTNTATAVLGGMAAGIRQGESTFAHIIEHDPDANTKKDLKNARLDLSKEQFAHPRVETESIAQQDIILDEFQKAYTEKNQSKFFSNPMSKMKKELSENQSGRRKIDMTDIEKHAAANPNSTTAQVLKELPERLVKKFADDNEGQTALKKNITSQKGLFKFNAEARKLECTESHYCKTAEVVMEKLMASPAA